MNRLTQTLEDLAHHKRKALVAYITPGFPSLKESRAIAETLFAAGVDILEIGVPFSDPIADGPTIQASSHYALTHGVTLPSVLGLVRQLRAETAAPILLMSYANPLLHDDPAGTLLRAQEQGVDGLIIPDMIPEESRQLGAWCRAAGLVQVFMVAPTTPPERMALIDQQSAAFVYIVSTMGVTGKRKGFSRDITSFLQQTRHAMPLHPRFLGFGISSAAQVRAVKKYVDGVIVGSALIEIIRQKTGRQRLDSVRKFISSLRTALDA